MTDATSTKETGHKHFPRYLWALLIASLIVAFVAWVATCLKHNGYVLTWPDMPDAVYEIESVSTITPLISWGDQHTQSQLFIDPDVERNGIAPWLANELEWARKTYDALGYRVTRLLDSRGLLAEHITALPSDTASGIDAAFRSSVEIVPSWNKPAMPLMQADVIEGADGTGNPLTVVTVRGSGNGDTYPYYEAVFRSDAAGIGPDTLIDHQRFNYDVAGMEGLEPVIQIMLLIYYLLCALCITALVYGLRRAYLYYRTIKQLQHRNTAADTTE